MTIEYTIDEDDFLIHQLYIASRSTRIKKKRTRNWIIVPVVYSVLALLQFLDGDIVPGFFFLLPGILWFIFFPMWERKYYVRHYRGFLRENYKERYGKTSSLALHDDYIVACDEGSESKVATTEIEGIIELGDIILIKLRAGVAIIIPARKVINNEGLVERLKQLANHLKVPYSIEDNWKWE